jgi:hypothetical protein
MTSVRKCRPKLIRQGLFTVRHISEFVQKNRIDHLANKSDCINTIEILDLEQVCLHSSCKHFWAKKNLVKSLLISTLDKVIYYIETFYRAQQNFSSLRKIGWRSAEKNLPVFFQHARSISRFL